VKFGSLSITTTDGRTREYPIDLPSLVVGRADGNSIVIEDLSVARRHARIIIDSGRLLLEDLGSAGGTFIAGQRIPPNTPSLVGEDQDIRFGDVQVRYQAPAAAGVEQPPGAVQLPSQPEPAPLSEAPAEIRTVLSVPALPVEPGGAPIVAQLTVHNRGQVVDELTITVHDLPPEWVRTDNPRLILRPGEQGEVSITIQAPKRSEAHAGEYDFAVTVTSKETGREALANGQLTILPFEGTTLALHPVRSKKSFQLIAENHGNALATFALSGSDDEEAFNYQFDAPTIELAAGQQSSLPFRVSQKQRKLFGRATAQPFSVVASPTTDRGTKATVQGQLAVSPPLEPLKRPAMFSVLLVLFALGAMVLFFLPSDNTIKAQGTEEAYAGVHLCDKDGKPTDASKQANEATPTKAGAAQVPKGAPNTGAPYFAQNDPQWATVEYAKAKDPDFGPDWCGTTIAQCGCAMTSVTTVMALYNILAMPDGSDLTPKAVNDWFNGNARKTSRGWVSQGYIYGDVIWTAANQLSGEIAKIRPGSRTIRFSRTGSGSEDEIRTELKAGRPVVVEVPGHWIAAVGLDGNKILINDPFYRDRKTLDAYAGKVRSSVLFEPSDDLSAVVITVPADERVRVTDKHGNVVGTLNAGSPEDAKKDAKVDIPGASYTNRQGWRDPTCIASAPPAGSGTNQIVLPGSAEDYKIEVLDTAGGSASVAIHTYDKTGSPSVKTIDNKGSVVASVGYDPTKGEPNIQQLDEKPQSDASSARISGAKPSPTAAAATAEPTAVPTPAAGPVTTILSASIPAGTKVVNIGSSVGFATGDTIRFSPGASNEEDNTIVGFGSFILAAPLKYAHSAGEPIVRLAGIPGGGGAPPPAPGPELKPPEGVSLSCQPIYSASPRTATLICTASIQGIYTTTRWTFDGRVQSQVTGQTVFLTVFTQDATAAIAVTACNVTVCTSDAATQTIRFPVSGGGAALPIPLTPTPTPTPIPPAPATGVNAICNTTLTISPTEQALIACEPLTRMTYSSITWTAPGLTPANDRPRPDGAPFRAIALPDDFTPGADGNATVLVTATLCSASTGTSAAACTTSAPTIVTLPYATTTLSLLPSDPRLGTSVTLFAVITGPVVPSGGTVRFVEVDGGGTILSSIGLDQRIVVYPGFAFANLSVRTGSIPLNTLGIHHIKAIYAGGTNIFGDTSDPVDLDINPPRPDICNSLDDNGDGDIDETCDIPGRGGVSTQKDIGAGTILSGIDVNTHGTAYDAVVPGEVLVVTAGASRKEAASGDPYCANCTRQVYIGIGENAAVVPRVAAAGPTCALNQSLSAYPPTVPPLSFTRNLRAPTTPGLYYLRATSSLQSGCGQPEVGGPDATIARLIVKGNTHVTMPGTLPSTVLGTTVRITAAVTSDQPGQVTGFVAFCDGNVTPTSADPCNGGTLLMTVPVTDGPVVGFLVTRQAVFDLDTTMLYSGGTPTPTGNHQISAHFLAGGAYPNPYYSRSDSALITLPLTAAATEVAVTMSSNPAVLGGTIAITAAVRSGEFGPFGGTVQFYDGARAIGAPQAVSGSEIGLATLAYDTAGFYPGTGVAPVGPHNLTAQYTGAGNYADSTSPASVLTVNAEPSTTTLTLSSPTAALGTTVTLTATLGDSSGPGGRFGAIGGTVQFKRSGSNIGGAQTVASGQATFDFDTATLYSSGLATGFETFTAQYIPAGGNYAGSISTSATLDVLPSVTTVDISIPSPNATLGTSLTITGTVHKLAGHDFGNIGGTIEFREGTVVLCTGTVGALTPGVASSISCNTALFYGAANPVGVHAVIARYLGSGNYAGADSASTPLTVTAATTTVAATIPATAALGSTITLAATVTSGAFGSFSGTIDFMEGATVLASGAVSGAGTASVQYDTTALYGGGGAFSLTTHNVFARYSGGGNYATQDSAPASALSITGATAGAVLAASPSTTSVGNTVSFTVTFSGPFGTPNGITVTVDTTGSPTGPSLSGTLAGGVVTVSTTSLTPGTYTYRANLPANGNYLAVDSNTVTVIILSPTNTLLTATPSKANSGSSVRVSAAVSCPSCSPAPNFNTGTVDVFEGTTSLGTINLASDGSGSVSVTTLSSTGTHTLWGRFYGIPAEKLAGSDSATINVVITYATTTVVTVPATELVNNSPPLTATITAAVDVGGNGTVQFYDGGVAIGGNIGVSSSLGISSATLSNHKFTTIGSHTITAAYTGAGSFGDSLDNTGAAIAIQSSTSTTVAFNPVSPVDAGAPGVTMTATVTATAAGGGAGAGGGGPVNSGSVQFKDGGVDVGTPQSVSGGTASLLWSSFDGGTHSITAHYIGAGNFAASTTETSNSLVVVALTSTTVTPVTSPRLLASQATVILEATVLCTAGCTGAGNFTGTVAFYDNGVLIPGSVTYSAVTGVATLSVTFTTLGLHPITAVYTPSGGSKYKTSTSPSVGIQFN
jgi:hypothetical protein